MKFKSKVDILQLLGYILFAGIGATLVIYSYSSYLFSRDAWSFLLYLLLIVLGFVLLIYSISALFKTYYQFKDDHIYVQSGLMKNAIPYKYVMNVKSSKKYFTFNCLSIDKLCISFREGAQMSKIHVSPKEKEEFINQIKAHCKSAKIER